jgi:hypothetical protein
MAEWRSMRGEDSTMQDMLLAMWAQPSPSQHILLIYIPEIALQLHILLSYSLLLDQERKVVLFKKIDVFCPFEAISPEFDVVYGPQLFNYFRAERWRVQFVRV